MRTDRAPRRQMFWFAIGGPAMSALWAIGLGSMLLAYPALHPVPQMLILGLAVMCALMAFATAFPTNLGGVPSDGMRILGIIQAPAEPAVDALCGVLLALTVGHRPRDWSKASVEAAVGYEDPTGTAQLLSYQNALDRDQWDGARELLAQALVAAVPAVSARIEGAFWAALVDRSAAVARAWLPPSVTQARGHEPAYYRALAVIRDVEGDAGGAAGALESARLALRGHEAPEGMLDFERDLQDYVKNHVSLG